MNRPGLLALVLNLGILLTASACASAGETGGDTGGGIPIVVENTAAPPNTFAVWIVKEGGIRQRLGTIRPNATGRFRYRAPGMGAYYLVAEPRTGSPVRSTSFDLSDVSARIEWDIGAGSVVVR